MNTPAVRLTEAISAKALVAPQTLSTMERKMETRGIIVYILGLYRGYMGIMEKKMKTTRVQGLGVRAWAFAV